MAEINRAEEEPMPEDADKEEIEKEPNLQEPMSPEGESVDEPILKEEELTLAEKEPGQEPEPEFDYEKRKREIEAKYTEDKNKLYQARDDAFAEFGITPADGESIKRRALQARKILEHYRKKRIPYKGEELPLDQKLILDIHDKEQKIEKERIDTLKETDEMEEKLKEQRIKQSIKQSIDKIGEI